MSSRISKAKKIVKRAKKTLSKAKKQKAELAKYKRQVHEKKKKEAMNRLIKIAHSEAKKSNKKTERKRAVKKHIPKQRKTRAAYRARMNRRRIPNLPRQTRPGLNRAISRDLYRVLGLGMSDRGFYPTARMTEREMASMRSRMRRRDNAYTAQLRAEISAKEGWPGYFSNPYN